MSEDFAQQRPTAEFESSTLTARQEESLDIYRATLKHQSISPREWLKRNPAVEITQEFRDQLWSHYALAYPPPRVPGFEIEDVLGEGGMGRVYLGRDKKLKRLAAIKELTETLRRSPQYSERFRMEAQVLAKLDHPNIVKVYQFISHEGREFIAMEYVGQGNLTEWLAGTKSEPVTAVSQIVAEVARAIDYAHGEKIIHRDLKPANILFDKQGRPKISDFGLAKDLLDPTDRTHGAQLGTAHFMAPEQVDGKPPVPGTDIWALGVILFRQLTGHFPFNGGTRDELYAAIRTGLPAARGDEIPKKLRAACMKCLEKDPSQRFLHARDLAKELEGNPARRRLTSNPINTPWHHRFTLTAGLVVAVLMVFVALAYFLTRGEGLRSPERMKDLHTGQCSSIVFTPDGLHAVSECGGGEIFIWDLQRLMKESSQLHGGEKPFQDDSGPVAASPDGKWIAAANLGFPLKNHLGIGFFNQATGKKSQSKIVINNNIGPSMVFSPDNSTLACVYMGIVMGVRFQAANLVLYNVQNENQWSPPLESPAQSLAYSPDGEILAMGCDDGKIRLWIVHAKRAERAIVGHTGAVDQLQFAKGGKQIFSASSDDDTLRSWKLESAEELKTISLKQSAAKMKCAAFCEGGRAVTGHGDGTIFAWDMRTGKELYHFQHKDTKVTAIAISPDGQKAVCALSDQSVYLHHLPAISRDR